jgi:hypothetical protein
MDTQGGGFYFLVGGHILIISVVSQYWENCRWVDPTDHRDLDKIVADLNREQAKHAKLRGCTVERICDAISKVRDSWQEEISDVEDDLLPINHFGNKRGVKRTSSFISGFMEAKMHEGAGDHHPYVQVEPFPA